jgi:hypothetical protein
MITLSAACSAFNKARLGAILLSIVFAFHSEFASAARRTIVAGEFAASTRQAAFSVQEEHSVDLVVVDLESGSIAKLRSAGNALIFPFLSLDGSRLVVVRQHPDSGESDLLSCTTDSFSCRRLLTLKGSISSPVEIDDHRILFISSTLGTRDSNLRAKYLGFAVNRYVRHDIWSLDVGQPPRRITDFGLYELHGLSVTANSVYFSAMGPRTDKSVIPKSVALQRPASDIYKLPFDRTSGSLILPEAQLKPVFLQEGYTYTARVSSDESLAALIRTVTSSPGRGFRYDLVVQDLRTGSSRTTEPAGLGFSRPVFVGKEIMVNELFDDRYIIKKILSDGASIRSVTEITDGSIIHALPTEIVVEQEAH